MRVEMGLRSHLHARFPSVLILAEPDGSGEILGPLGPKGFHLTPTCSSPSSARAMSREEIHAFRSRHPPSYLPGPSSDASSFRKSILTFPPTEQQRGPAALRPAGTQEVKWTTVPVADVRITLLTPVLALFLLCSQSCLWGKALVNFIGEYAWHWLFIFVTSILFALGIVGL
jgi:hypothetical protein